MGIRCLEHHQVEKCWPSVALARPCGCRHPPPHCGTASGGWSRSSGALASSTCPGSILFSYPGGGTSEGRCYLPERAACRPLVQGMCFEAGRLWVMCKVSGHGVWSSVAISSSHCLDCYLMWNCVCPLSLGRRFFCIPSLLPKLSFLIWGSYLSQLPFPGIEVVLSKVGGALAALTSCF